MTNTDAFQSRRVIVSGASGLIGSALCRALIEKGCMVQRLIRCGTPGGLNSNEHARDIAWDPAAATIDAAALEGTDAVVHLAGERVAKRWTTANKASIRKSRVEGTALLARALASLRQKPRVLVCASAIGTYGDRGAEEMTEDSPPGRGFLAEVCRDWEAAAQPARDAGIRVVNLRIGMVLSAQGGALHAMLCPFRAGLGGVLGNGRQYMSWIAIDDLVRAILFLLRDEQTLSGPVNAVAPNPVTNAEFTRALARVLLRPAILPVPRWAIRFALGQMGQELLLSSARVVPVKLLEAGFSYLHPSLESALRSVL